jgi:transposase-like protein
MNQTAIRSEALSPTAGVPDPEVNGKPRRRTFTAQFKVKILKETQACRKPGDVGALLRREGLYSSHLTHWRREYEQGVLKGLGPKKRGRKPLGRSPLVSQVAKLQKENEKLQKRLRQAEAIIEIQKKACELLGVPSAQELHRRSKGGKNA